jgi:hypothetical protein
MNDEEFISELTVMLEKLLQAHGQEVSHYKDWLILNNNLPAIRCHTFRDPNWHPSINQVDFEIFVAKGNTIYVSFGVIGDRNKQILEALHKFSKRSLHVILESINRDERQLDQVEVEMWGNPEIGLWRTVLGSWLVQTFDEIQPNFFLPDIKTIIRPLVEQRFRQGTIHWFRCYYSTLASTVMNDTLWDNEPWPIAEKVIQNLEWPSQRFSAGLFIMMTKM